MPRPLKREEITDDRIVEYVRRFGPVVTNQIKDVFGLSTSGLSLRLRGITRLKIIKEGRAVGNLWGINNESCWSSNDGGCGNSGETDAR